MSENPTPEAPTAVPEPKEPTPDPAAKRPDGLPVGRKFFAGTSGNPKGRSSSRTFREALLARLGGSPERLADEVLAIIRNKRNSSRVRLQAIQLAIEFGWGRAPMQLSVETGAGPGGAIVFGGRFKQEPGAVLDVGSTVTPSLPEKVTSIGASSASTPRWVDVIDSNPDLPVPPPSPAPALKRNPYIQAGPHITASGEWSGWNTLPPEPPEPAGPTSTATLSGWNLDLPLAGDQEDHDGD